MTESGSKSKSEPGSGPESGSKPESKSGSVPESGSVSGVVRALSAWCGRDVPLREVTEGHVTAHQGFDGDPRGRGDRGITLLSAERWTDAIRELGKELPWHTRRANLLTEGIDLAATVGKRVRIGSVEVAIHGVSRPCGVMDRMCPGLREVLKPDSRGGVHGEVLKDGTIRAGDTITVIDSV